MSLPLAYSPQTGYRYQILTRNPQYNGREWEACDYATDKSDKEHLLTNYRQAYGAGWLFKVIVLPAKYWPGAVTKRPAKKRKPRKARTA